MDLIVGIDLGTTNSEVAYIREGQPHVCTEDGDPILPSFVGLAEDGRLLVGKSAKNQWVLAPERTIKSIKRKMGQDVKVKLGDDPEGPGRTGVGAAGLSGQEGCHHGAGLLQRRSATGHQGGGRAGRPG